MVSALDYGSRGPSLSPSRVTVLCSWARNFTLTVACSRPSVSGSVRAAGERGKNERGLGRDGALSLPRLFSLAAGFVRYHRLRAWNRLLSQCLSPPRINWVPVNCQGNRDAGRLPVMD